MDASVAVEREVDKVMNRLTSFNDRTSKQLQILYDDIETLKKEIEESKLRGKFYWIDRNDILNDFVLITGIPEENLTVQMAILKQSLGKVKEIVSSLSCEHRDLHSSVSKIGKAIDKVFTFKITF